MALVNYGDSDFSDSDGEERQTITSSAASSSSKFNDTVEKEFKMRIPRNAKPILEPLNIKRKTALNGKILLSIPTVEEFDSSDDSDDEGSFRKSRSTVRPSSGSGGVSSRPQGLLDLLPPTRALIVKEGDKPIIPMLVPKQVSRRPPKTSAKLPTAPSHPEAMEEDDLDVDEPSTGGFFSFYETKTSAQDADDNAVAELRRQAQQTLTVPPTAEKRKRPVEMDPVVAFGEVGTSQQLPPLPVKPINDADLPRPSTSNPIYSDEEEGDGPEPVFTEANFIPGPERKRARWKGGVADVLASGAVKEIRQDDLTAGSKLELVKNITTGAGKPKVDHLVDAPGRMAFRKHQITWLAYQAQEKEYELQEQWAENRRNQMQSRQKYGF